MSEHGTFHVQSTDSQHTGETLIVGQAHLGMAGVTAADYLVRHLDSTQIGHVSPSELPAIAPFEDGVPRHHSRLYTLDQYDISVLVDELFVPVAAARPYVDGILEWVQERAISEVIVLHGVPFPHGPDEHEVFYVATPGYRERRVAGTALQPLKGGYLDGVVGELVTRSLDDKAPETGVFATPTHPPGPDIDAALKLLAAIEDICGFDVDETELREFGEQLKQHYEQLAERMAALSEGDDEFGSHDYPEDRMYM